MKSIKKVTLFDVILAFICAAVCGIVAFINKYRFDNDIITVMCIIAAAAWSIRAIYELVGFIRYNKEKKSINPGLEGQR